MSPPSRRLAVVVSHPIQYYSPWFRWLAREGWTLRVFYLWDFGVVRRKDAEFAREFAWDVDLLSGYEHEFVPNRSPAPTTHAAAGLFNPALLRRLSAWNPDAVLLFGYKYLTHLALILAARHPLIFRGDSHLLDTPAPSLLKRYALAALYARFAAVTYVGRANHAYFRAFDVPTSRLFHAPHCVDADFFTASPARLAEARALKRSLGLADKRVVLFAGKLIAKKQPRELLSAFLSLDDPTTSDTALVFVGEGAELDELRALAATRPDKAVRFLPFANQSEMPVRYLLADVFALPSRGPGETWGLAVNEAMHLGVPCLVSDRVGCQLDLVSDGETGWVFPAASPEALRGSLQRALHDVARDSDGFRRRVLARVSAHTYAAAAAGLARALDCATRPPPVV